MKYVIGMFFSIVLYGSELDTMDDIVNDIQNLRADYTSCKNTLGEYKVDSLKKEKNNKIFEKEVNNLKNILKTKDIAIENLQNKINILIKNKENNKNTLVLVEKEVLECLDENPFPILMMKKPLSEKEEQFKASSFRLIKNSSIYDSINGNKIAQWEEKSSFTSNTMSENWIKITGFFVDRQWQKSKESLWIKKENIIKR
ncbi:MAG: hypothetical protein Q9M32_08635 [Sulfurimonas sp.]|nr:hypothetical protein [Sulfurimonas sp.]